MNTALTYFEPIVAKQRIKNRIIGVVMLVVCAVGAAWGFSLDVSEYPAARMATLAVLCFPVCLFALVWNILPHRGLAALRGPSRIVWHYGVQKGGKVNAVMVGFEDGKLHRFDLPLISIKEGFSQEAFQHLRASAPNAAAGFSEERRKAFLENPASLLG